MNWQQALRQRLLDAPAVSAIIAARATWRVRPADGPLPALVLTTVSDPRPQTLKEFYPRRESRVQLDCYAATQAEVSALCDAAIAALAPGGAFSGIKFGRANFDPVRDLGTETETGFVHRYSFDILIWHD